MSEKKNKPNWFDKGLAMVAPKFALERKYYRDQFMFSYDAANLGRASVSIGGTASLAAPESLSNQRDRIQMMWESRRLANNYSFFKSILLKEAMYVCGSIRYQSQTGDADTDREYEQYFREWEQKCDLTMRYPFRHLIQLAHMGMRRDGDHGFAMVTQGKELRLQSVESDRIGNPNEGGKSEDNYIGGITINSLGQPVSYRVFRRTLHGQYVEPREVPRSNFVHYIDPLRADQYRGITAFETAIPHAKDLYELLQAEKMAVKFAASHAGVLRTKDHGPNTWKSSAAPTGADKELSLEKVHPGKLLRLNPEDDVSLFDTSRRPSPTFNGFIQTLVREMANGLNLPFAFVWDMSEFGGATARLEVQAAHRAFQRHQTLLMEQVLNPIKNAVIGRAIAYRDLKPHPNYRKGRWQFNSQITADLGHEVQANISLLESGLKTRESIYGEMGRDFEEEAEKVAKEVVFLEELSRKYGIPLGSLVKSMEGTSDMIAQFREAQDAEARGLYPTDQEIEAEQKQMMAQAQVQAQFQPPQNENSRKPKKTSR
jgi:lambda family phage portal protein